MGFWAYLWQLAAAAFKSVKGKISATAAVVSFVWPPLKEALGVVWDPHLPPTAGFWVRVIVVLTFPLAMLWEAHKLYIAEVAKSDPDKRWDDQNAAVDRGMQILKRGKKVSGGYASSQQPEARQRYTTEMAEIAQKVRELLAADFPKSEAAKFDAIEVEPNAEHREQRLFNAQMAMLDTILAMATLRLQNSKKA